MYYPGWEGLRACEALTPERVAALARQLEDGGNAPATIRRRLSHIGPIAKRAMRRGAIPVNPLTLLLDDEKPSGSSEREVFVPSVEEITRLLDCARAFDARPTCRQPYSFPGIALLVYAGPRIGEGLALQKMDIDPRGFIRFGKQWTRQGVLAPPKTPSSVRTVATEPWLPKALLDLLPPNAFPTAFPFAAEHGRNPISYHNWRARCWEPVVKAAGLEGLRIHDLRHAHGSFLLDAGIPLTVVSQRLGHKDPSITARVYSHKVENPKTEAQVVAALGRIAGGSA